MPSVYLLVHALPAAGGRVVLLGNKNIIGNRINGAPHAQVIWNSAGQVVISGGRKNAHEPWADGAAREFFEETGVDFRQAAVRAVYGVAHPWPPPNVFFGPGNAYAVVYVEIGGGNIGGL